MWCVIPAAGRGTRMQTLTSGRPKALLGVSGRPLITLLLDRLSGSITDVCIVTGPRDAETFRRLLGELYGDLRLHLAVQDEPLGVADAVSRAAGICQGPAGSTFNAIPYQGWRRNINTPSDLRAVKRRIVEFSDPESTVQKE